MYLPSDTMRFCEKWHRTVCFRVDELERIIDDFERNKVRDCYKNGEFLQLTLELNIKLRTQLEDILGITDRRLALYGNF